MVIGIMPVPAMAAEGDAATPEEAAALEALNAAFAFAENKT